MNTSRLIALALSALASVAVVTSNAADANTKGRPDSKQWPSLFKPDLSNAEPGSILREIGRRRGCLVKGGEVELTKAAQLLLNDLRGGALGKITFELP